MITKLNLFLIQETHYVFIVNNMIKKYCLYPITHILVISLLLMACSSAPRKTYSEFESFQEPLAIGGLGPKMIVVPAGKFIMGTSETQRSVFKSEHPAHPVHIKKPFAIGQFELTFQEYDEFVKSTGYQKPSDLGWGSKYWGRGKTPVFNVSWHDAKRYLAWLSQQTGAHYRLPTEAEWEYAARAGTTSTYTTGECITADQANFHDKEQYANCEPTGQYRGKAIETGTFKPNAWGLYDVHGNILEWTEDCWHDSYDHAPADGSAWLDEDDANCQRRVLRGGSWSGRAVELRSGTRSNNLADFKSIFIGFRVVRELE